jgi:hypothetical protein
MINTTARPPIARSRARSTASDLIVLRQHFTRTIVLVTQRSVYQ